MKSKNLFSTSFLFFVIVLLQNCSSPAQLANSNIEITGDYVLENLSPPNEKAVIYIIRKPKHYASVMNMRVEMNQIIVGSTQAKRFLYAVVNPGMHKLIGKANNESELNLEVKKGEIYYVEQKAVFSMHGAKNELVLMGEEEGKELLRKCKLSKNNYTRRGLK